MHRMNEAMPLVRIAADYDSSRLIAQTPGKKGVWDGIRFTLEEVLDCDYFVMLNNRRANPVTVRCPREHVWCLIQEPYVPGIFEWLVENHEPYARVFTQYIPVPGPKYVRSQPAMSWEIDLSYDDLAAMSIPSKTAAISYVAAKEVWLPRQRKRNALRNFLMRTAPDKVDLFGRGFNYIENKWNAIAPYRYSIAVENSFGNDYWTEKLSECFLSWTVPLYDGCPNLEDYFPADSFIRIDAADHAATLATINQLLQHDEWERRLPALKEARRRFLERYNLFATIAQAVRTYGSNDREPTLMTIPGYSGMSLRNRLRYYGYMVRQKVMDR
jgi:hypothetical protein